MAALALIRARSSGRLLECLCRHSRLEFVLQLKQDCGLTIAQYGLLSGWDSALPAACTLHKLSAW